MRNDQGMIEVEGGRIWYQVLGSGDRTPLVALHGGPGFPHDSLAPLAELGDVRKVVFYDQLGCGKSDRPDDPALWNVPRFVAELASLVSHLGIESMHLFGHSWGTILAVEYQHAYPEHVRSLILASPVLSVPRWRQDGQTHLSKMSAEDQAVIARHDAGEEHDPEAFKRAEKTYSSRHFFRPSAWPEEMKQAGAGFGGGVYHAMWGDCEWKATGSLKAYDCVDHLPDVTVPVLLTCGRYDEATPQTCAWHQQQFPDARLRIFENSAHMAHFEEREEYLAALREFLEEFGEQ